MMTLTSRNRCLTAGKVFILQMGVPDGFVFGVTGGIAGTSKWAEDGVKPLACGGREQLVCGLWRLGRNVFVNDSPGSHKSVFTHGDAADDGAVGAQGCAAFD